MKVMLVHLGDIHIEAQTDPILKRIPQIIDAIKNLESTASAVVFVLSGDVTYSGTDDQYLIALDFVETLKATLVPHVPKNCKIAFVAVPGNHDCDFSEATDARSVLLEAVLKTPSRLNDESFADICLAPQRKFFQFREAIDSLQMVTHANVDSRMYVEYELTLGDQKVVFCCCNSAALSQLHEKPGSLAFPHKLLPENKAAVAVSVGVIHHPMNWMQPSVAKKFRKSFEAITDIVLTGHEHDADRRNVRTEVSNNLYIEGGVLQESGNPITSDYYVIVIDTDAQKQRMLHFAWNGDRYECTNCEDPMQYHLWEDFTQNRYRLRAAFRLLPKHRDYLDDPEITLTHHSKGLLRLSDIFVYPDLKKINIAGEKTNIVIHGDNVLRLINEKACVFIIGDSLSGKTSLAKRIFLELHAAGDVPVLIDGAQLASSFDSIDRLVEECFCRNYDAAALTMYRQLDRARRVLIIDNYNKLRLSSRGKIDLLNRLRQHSFRLVVFSHDLEITYHDLSEATDASMGELPFSYYSILPFTLQNRNRMVERWLLLDESAEQDATKFVHNLERINRVIDTLVGKNYVPAFPCYLLAVLQAAEMGTEVDTHGSTHGYLYELFIKTTIAKRVSPSAFNTISVLLSHVAYWMYEHTTKFISRADFRTLHEELQKRIEVLPPFEKATAQLTELQVLAHTNDMLSFKHPYIYYYFLALYMRDRLSDEELQLQARSLSTQLYKEDNANTMLFLCHLSKKKVLLDILLESADSQFSDVAPSDLGGDVSFMNDMYGAVTRIQLPDGPIKQMRAVELALQDAAREEVIHFEEEARHELENEASMIGKLNAALKTIQIVGQFLKNFPADLEKDEKDRVIGSCCNLGRRALGSFLGVVGKNEAQILEEMIFLVSRRRSGLAPQKLRERAVSAVVALCELGAYGIITRMSSALGSRELATTYDRLFPKFREPIMQLVYISLQLDHYEEFPEALVRSGGRNLRDNALAFRVLRSLVVRHLSLFPTDFRLKQHLSDVLMLQFRRGGAPSGDELLVEESKKAP